MTQEVRMPPLGQTTDELRIVAWLKAEGDQFALGEPLLEVDTDKATLQVESFGSGTLLKILYAAGETVRVGTLVAYVGEAGETVTTSPPTPLLSGEGRSREEAPVEAEVETPRVGDKVLASPAARQLAKEHGLDLARVRGGGPAGRIERKDVLALIEKVARAQPEIESPVPRHRQAIAQRLTHSIRTIPCITLTMSVNMRQAQTLLISKRAEGLNGLTYTHLILRAVAHALRQHPRLNRLWLDEGPRFRQLSRVDVGLAIAGEDTLLVATIPEPDRVSLTELVKITEEAICRARSGSLSQADLLPTAITVSNLGMYGVEEFDAIIDPDQAAILATGQVADQVVAINGGIHVVPQMKMSLAVDHRIADGVAAAQFLTTVRQQLENAEDGVSDRSRKPIGS
jgi:pyruvate dehydrogenase E2 component (dihydrolipoamide acetyltransferase)